ncbi:hypothetical protein BAE44_0001186 [Dichanthelium oligosanthes]|uniref:Uncharacterized protein n=1 Tax=Dichanthelium oligosanthes TaxID=888268 RepID=A0A1E5WK66_9POAL|nr:hypothetical protein BAE44_0001186 [Dichanthelium oligosanthes]
MLDPCKISFCTLNFCGQEPTDLPEQTFLELFAGLERLHLTSARLSRGVVDHIVLSSGLKFPTFPFPALRNLELTGMLPEEDDTTTEQAITAGSKWASLPGNALAVNLGSDSLTMTAEPDLAVIVYFTAGLYNHCRT